MVQKLYEEDNIQAIADAIRSKNGETTSYTTNEMAAAISSIQVGDGTSTSGEDGGYYIPSINEAGDLSWTASKPGMESVPSANIKGPQGDPGAAGYTPVKGTDYWTEADKAEIVADTLAALPTWTGGSY